MRILICSDGSKWAYKSARFALQLFRDTAHELTILVFKQCAAKMSSTKKTITRATREKEDNIGAQRSPDLIDEEVHELVEDLAIDGTDIRWLHEEGDMARHILDIAKDYDLVCLGGAGKGGFSQNMLGLIADEVVTEGKGNLMVTKSSDVVCKNILLAVTPSSLSEGLAHYVGTLFEGSPAAITIDVLWDALPQRFAGYLEATPAQRVTEMVDADLFDDPDHLQNIIEIIESYGIESSFSYRDYKSLSQLIDDVEFNSYDLIIVHPESPKKGLTEGLLQFVGAGEKNQSLDLMRKSSPNVMLIRSLPNSQK